MTKKQFQHDFLRGLGSALRELKTCEHPEKYAEIVRYGCLHNTTYDMQSEGDRGWYLHQAALRVGGSSIENAVIARFSRPFADIWLFDQLTSILYSFAADGSKAARTALYEQYAVILDKLSHMRIPIKKSVCNDMDMFEWLCVWLTSLDGWGAFQKILGEVTEVLFTRDEELFFFVWFYANSKTKFGKKRVESYLAKQAEKNGSFRNYWVKTQEWDHHTIEKQPNPTLEEVIEGSGGKYRAGRGLSMRFARNACQDDLARLYSAAMAEPDLERRADLLWGLRRAKFPLPEEWITELLKSENEDIRDTAFSMMENNPSPKVREYALSLLKKGEDVVYAIRLVSKNLRPSDEQLFCELVESIPVKLTEGEWHSAFMSAITGMEALRGKPKTDLLMYM